MTPSRSAALLAIFTLALSLPARADEAREGVFRTRLLTSDGVHAGLYRYVPDVGATSTAVLLFPDVGMSHRAFDHQGRGLARFLKQKGLETFVLEYRGAGISDVPFGGFTLTDLALKDAEAAFARAATGKAAVYLGGCGFGATLALLLAARHPGAVKGVVALQPVLTLDLPNEPMAKLLEAVAMAPAWIDLPSLSKQELFAGRSWFEVLIANDGTVAEGVAEDFRSRVLTPLPRRLLQELAGFMREKKLEIDGAEVKVQVASWKGPTLVVYAPRDNWVHPEFATPIRDVLGRARLTVKVLNRAEGASLDYGHLGLLIGSRAEREIWTPVLRFLQAGAVAL